MNEGFAKSALDRAMERADQIEVPESKLKEIGYRSEGERIAAAVLRDPEFNVESELARYEGDARKQVIKAVESILLQNLTLRNEGGTAKNEELFQKLAMLKKNKSAVNQAKAQLQNLTSYYMQTRQQNYDQLKSQFEQAVNQAAQQKGGAGGMKVNVEQYTEFQDKWRQILRQIDTEYDKAMEQLKQQVMELD
ncbi:MAG: hypothetical protein ACLFVK_07590 [Dehalococcoidia bacterium]